MPWSRLWYCGSAFIVALPRYLCVRVNLFGRPEKVLKPIPCLNPSLQSPRMGLFRRFVRGPGIRLRVTGTGDPQGGSAAFKCNLPPCQSGPALGVKFLACVGVGQQHLEAAGQGEANFHSLGAFFRHLVPKRTQAERVQGAQQLLRLTRTSSLHLRCFGTAAATVMNRAPNSPAWA